MTFAGTTRAQRFTGYFFVLPYFLLFAAFVLLPLLFGLGLSFAKYDMLSPGPAKFIGAENYREAVHDPYFWKALSATTKFVIFCSPLTAFLALLLAAGVNSVRGERRQHVYRTLIFLPTIVSIAVAGLVWRWFFSTEFGLFNAMLAPLGIKLPWLTQTGWAMASIVLMTLWWTVGGPMVVLLAGLKQIPEQYYEAAAIDGAVGWKSFRFITLPLLRPVLLFVVVINVLGAFQIFGQTFIVTKGGPERSTHVLMQYIYDVSFNNYRLGYGSAMSWLLFLVIAAISIVQFRVLRERD